MKRILTAFFAVFILGGFALVYAQHNMRGAERGHTSDPGGQSHLKAVASGPDETPPTVSTATIPGNGTRLYLGFNEVMKYGAGGNGTTTAWGIDMNGTTGEGLSYDGGNGTQTLQFAITGRTILVGEGGNATYTQPGNGWEDRSGNDLASFSKKVTNNSTQTNITEMCSAGCTAFACEDIEGTANPGAKYRCSTWVEEDPGASCTISTQASSSQCTDRGDLEMKIALTAGGAGNYCDTYATISSATAYYAQFYFKVASSSLTSGGVANIASFNDVGWATILALNFKHDGSKLVFQTIYKAQGSDVTTDSTTECEVNTWYRVRFYWKSTATELAKISVAKWQATDTVLVNVGDVYNNLGVIYPWYGMYTPSAAATLVFDNIKHGTSPIETACAGDAN